MSCVHICIACMPVYASRGWTFEGVGGKNGDAASNADLSI